MNSHELKVLQVQVSKARAESDAKLSELKRAQGDSDRAKNNLQKLEKRISDALESNKDPVVTEHALLRYIERVYGIDLDAVRKKILTPSTIKAIKVVGSGKFPLDAGGRAVVKGNTIVSIEN